MTIRIRADAFPDSKYRQHYYSANQGSIRWPERGEKAKKLIVNCQSTGCLRGWAKRRTNQAPQKNGPGTMRSDLRAILEPPVHDQI